MDTQQGSQMSAKTEYHWGKWVSSDIPTTGVISCNSLEWIYEETDYRAVTNLSYDNYLEYHLGDMTRQWQQDNDTDDTPDDDLLEQWRDELGEQYEENCDTFLIGDWVADSTGQYQIDYGGTNHFAAIVDYDFSGGIVQVVWSRYVTSARLCSPCCPGQCDLDSNGGDYMGYDLPLSMYGEFRQTTELQRIYNSDADFRGTMAHA